MWPSPVVTSNLVPITKIERIACLVPASTEWRHGNAENGQDDCDRCVAANIGEAGSVG